MSLIISSLIMNQQVIKQKPSDSDEFLTDSINEANFEGTVPRS